MMQPGKAITLALMASAAAAGHNAGLAADAGNGPAPRELAYDQPFDALPTAGPDELAALRGGMRAGGLDLMFAANVRTLVNGALVLESAVNLTPGGTTVTQSNMPGTGVDATTLSFVSGQGAQPQALPAGLSGLAGQMGVVVEDSSGITTALHSVTREQILSVVLTSASDQQIRQEINVDVTIANFGEFQNAARSALLSGRLLENLNFTR